MREIIFRGKRKDNGAWETGSLVVTWRGLSDEGVFILDKIIGYHTPVISESVGQYTGLTDKNGKKIFEGDIDQYGYICTFTNGAFQMCCFKDGKCIQSIPFWGCDNLMIVGNIHDNQESTKETQP